MKFKIFLLSAVICAMGLQDVQAQFGGVRRKRPARKPAATSQDAQLPDWAQGANQKSGGAIGNAVSRLRKKTFTAIAGTRVYDALTGELLDDARVIRIDEDEKVDYEEITGDSIYTHSKVVISDDEYIGPTMQRVKETLIQALYEADRLDPVVFLGENLMALEERQKSERQVRWALRPASRGVGNVLVEVPTDRPVDVPNYYVEQENKDKKIGGESGWAKVFLDYYRVDKGNLQSEFLQVYIPKPPARPTMEPPSADWSAFTGIQNGLSSGDDYDEDGNIVAPGEREGGGKKQKDGNVFGGAGGGSGGGGRTGGSYYNL